ncbi:hypothetical protein BH10ACT1_BH10ACT1_00760 [soil metagenome]
MVRSKFSVLVGALTLLVAASACQPVQQLDIDFTVRKTGSFRPVPNVANAAQVTLSGVLACSGGTTSDSEHLDLFLTLSRSSKQLGGGEAHDNCQNEPKVWTKTWIVSLPPGTDLAASNVVVQVTACTNPGDTIDEDCETARQSVELTKVA